MRTLAQRGLPGTMGAMAVERQVTCPQEGCASTFATKASQNVRINCHNCGKGFRAPAPSSAPSVPPAAPEQPAKAPSSVQDPGAPATPPLVQPDAPGPSNVTIVRADTATFKERKSRRKSTAAKNAQQQPTKKSTRAKQPLPDAPPPAPSQPSKARSEAKTNGRKGGVGFHQRMFRAG